MRRPWWCVRGVAQCARALRAVLGVWAPRAWCACGVAFACATCTRHVLTAHVRCHRCCSTHVQPRRPCVCSRPTHMQGPDDAEQCKHELRPACAQRQRVAELDRMAVVPAYAHMVCWRNSPASCAPRVVCQLLSSGALPLTHRMCAPLVLCGRAPCGARQQRQRRADPPCVYTPTPTGPRSVLNGFLMRWAPRAAHDAN